MAADVTIIIPNWNGADRLRTLLPALRRQSAQPARVVVVDNGSTDGSRGITEAEGLDFIALAANLGFAAAVNTGIGASSTRWVAILNNDVAPEPGWLERLLEAAERAQVEYATGRLVHWTRPDTLDGCFDLLSRSGLAWRAGHGQPAARYMEPRRIRCAPFTAILLLRSLFDRVGLLDERFGSYLEDVDFGLRCAAMGVEGLYEPSAAARHEGSATLGAWSPRMVELLSRNQMLLIAKHFPEGWVSRFGFPVIVGQLLWALMATRHGRLLPWLRGKRAALADWGDWRRHAEAAPAAVLETILRKDEELIRKFQAEGKPDRFWSLYFRLLGAR
jgi:hypothetical protein